MKRKKSYLVNFPTELLFIVLEQNQQQLLELEIKRMEKESKELVARISQIKLTIALGKRELIRRYLNSEISLKKVAKLLCKSKGIRQEVYKEVFTQRAIQSKEFINVDLLKKAIDCLDLEQIMILMKQANVTYRNLAEKRYDQFIFDVDEEIYQVYLQKRKGLRI